MKKIPITDYLYADSETGAQRLNCSRATRSALKAVLPQVIRRELHRSSADAWNCALAK